MKVKIIFDLGSERIYISRRAKNILNLTLLNSEKLKINIFGSAGSKVTTVHELTFLLKPLMKK